MYYASVNVSLIAENVNGSNQKWNNNKCRCESKIPKKDNSCKKNHVWNPNTWSIEKSRQLESIIDNSVITCDECNEETKTIPTKTVLTKVLSIFY